MAVVVAGLWADGARAQTGHDAWCGTTTVADALRPATATTRRLPLHGEIRALLVFVQFQDDTRTGDCARGYETWPPGALLPEGADQFLASTPYGPAPDTSLTALYRTASRGRLEVYGDVFGHITAQRERGYFGTRLNIDRGEITQEVLDALVAQGVDLAQYDANADGQLDQLILVFRSIAPGHGLIGCTWVAGAVQSCVSGVASLYFPGEAVDLDDYNVDVAWNSGQLGLYDAIQPHMSTVALIAHELGHQLWTESEITSVHLDPIQYNGIPRTPSGPIPGALADRSGAFALMLGGATNPVFSRTTYPSAAERALASRHLAAPESSWIECPEAVPGQTYELGDTFRTGDCVEVRLATAAGPSQKTSSLILSGLYRTSPFGETRRPTSRISQDCPGCHTIEAGLPTTGVLMEVVQHNAQPPLQAERDIIPADGVLQGLQACDLPVGVGGTLEGAFREDLWQADPRLAIHPFTHPNVYGYASLGTTPEWLLTGPPHELSNFREAPSGRVAFDYRTDLLARDSLVAYGDWSFGSMFGPLQFDAFRFAAPGRLQVGAGTQLALGSADLRLVTELWIGRDVTLDIETLRVPPVGSPFDIALAPSATFTFPGALRVGGGLTLELGTYTTLVVEGALTMDVPLVVPAGGRVVVRGDLYSSGTVEIGEQGRLVVEGAIRAPAAATLTLYDGAELTLGDGLVLDAGASLTMRIGSVLRLDGSLLVERGAHLALGGSTVEMAPGAHVEIQGSTTLTPEQRNRFSARDPAAGWGGLRITGDHADPFALTRLVVTDVVGAPALTIRGRNGGIWYLELSGTRGGGGMLVEGGSRVILRAATIDGHAGIGLQATGGSDVELVPPLALRGNASSLSAVGATLRSRCTTRAACGERIVPYDVRRDLAAGGFDVEVREGGRVFVPFGAWSAPRVDGLVVVDDSTGVLDIEPFWDAADPEELPEPPDEVFGLAAGPVVPNPTLAGASVRVEVPFSTGVALTVVDVLGRRVWSDRRDVEPGRHRPRLREVVATGAVARGQASKPPGASAVSVSSAQSGSGRGGHEA